MEYVHVYEVNCRLVSTLDETGTLALTVEHAPAPVLESRDEIVVELMGAAVNPSDIGLLIGPADPTSARRDRTEDGQGRTILDVPASAVGGQVKRFGVPMIGGNEGFGRVVGAGDSDEARALLGCNVAIMGGSMYARYRAVPVRDSIVLSADVTPREGSGALINPLTALGMVETMREEGFTALVHSAAASSLGQMLCRLCQMDGVGLVNIVRSAEQALLLTEIGAEHVCDTSAPSFEDDLALAIEATGAMLAFDALGGGPLAGQILRAMERAGSPTPATFNRYGSTMLKKVYLYGGLDARPTEIQRNFGMAWAMGGWLLFTFLERIGPTRVNALKHRASAEVKTTFANTFTRAISLVEACDPDIIRSYAKRATGEKYMIDPSIA